jgi:hypothetical protein
MAAMLTRLEPLTEFAVPRDVTADQLTRHIDELVDEQVRQIAELYQRLIADLERQARYIKRSTRDAWLNTNRPAAQAGDPAAIRRRLANLPPCPSDCDERRDIPDGRSEPRARGVYLRLRGGCYRNADMRAYDAAGVEVERVCVTDDPILRLGSARFLWSVLEWFDPLSEPASRRPFDG